MSRKFKNINKRREEGPSEFVCGNEHLDRDDFRKLTNSDIKKLESAESSVKEKSIHYRNARMQRNAPYVTHLEQDLIYIPLAFHQFVDTGDTDNQSVINTYTDQKKSVLYSAYNPLTQDFSGPMHRSAFNAEFYQAVIEKLNGYMDGTGTAMTTDNYEGNAINNVNHGVESKIRFMLAPVLPVKFFTEYLTNRDDPGTLSSVHPPSGWYNDYNVYSSNYASVVSDHFDLPYLEQGLNGRTSFNYTNAELTNISAAAETAYNNAFLAYDTLLSETMSDQGITEEEAIEFLFDTPEAIEYSRTKYIHQMKGLVPCGPSGAVLTYDLSKYDICKLVELHSDSTGEYIPCTDITECTETDCPKDFPFAHQNSVNPTGSTKFNSTLQNGRLGHMLPTHNVWTYLAGVKTSAQWTGLGPSPTMSYQGNLYMSDMTNYSFDVDKYAQVLLHELGHTFGMPHTFQGGLIDDLVQNAASYTIPKFSIPLSEADASVNGGNNLLEPSEDDAQYIKSIHKVAQTLPFANNNTEPGGDISLKIGFPTRTVIVNENTIDEYSYEIKEVNNFENHGFTAFNHNTRARRRIIYHLLNTGVFWGNVDTDQNNKLVFNRVLKKVYTPDIFNDFNYYINDNLANTLPTFNLLAEVPPIDLDLNQLILGIDPTTDPSTSTNYSLVLFDSTDSAFDNIKETVFNLKNTTRKLYLYFTTYDREITYSITISGVTYESVINPASEDADGNIISYFPEESEIGVTSYLYTAVLAEDTENITLKWDTNSSGESKLVSVEFDYSYRPVDVLTRMPFCKLDETGAPTDVFDEFWWFNLNWLDESYPPYPDNWLTSKIYDEFDDDNNSLCPCLYKTQYYTENVGNPGVTSFTAVHTTESPYNTWRDFMIGFEEDTRWKRYFQMYYDVGGWNTGYITLHNSAYLRYHPVHFNFGNMGHAPLFGTYGYSPIGVMPRVFKYELEAVLPDLMEDGIYLDFATKDNLQPDIPREHTKNFLSPAGPVGEKFTEFYNKIGVGDTDSSLETYNPYRISQFDEKHYPSSYNFMIDRQVSGFSSNITIANNNTFLETPVDINTMYNAMDYTGKAYMFINGKWGTDIKQLSVSTPLGNSVAKRRTLFSPEGIFRIESNVESGLGKWGGVKHFGETVKDLDSGSIPIQALISEIENYIIGNEITNVPGCTDPDAANYNPGATVNDGSCTYLGDDCDYGGWVGIPVCVDSDITTCNFAGDDIISLFDWHEYGVDIMADVSQLVYTEEYPEPPEGCTGGGIKYMKNCPTCTFGNDACEYGTLEVTGCASGLTLTQEEIEALGPENYTLICPVKNYTITANLYTSGNLYYTGDGKSYSGFYCFRNDGLVYSGTFNAFGERLYSKEDFEVSPLPSLESESKNFNKIKTSIRNICRFVNG